MSMMMRLSDEEIAIIEQKRAEEKAKEEAWLKSYECYREKQISQQQKRNERQEKDWEQRKTLYETIYKELIAVSKDFKLTCKKMVTKPIISLYDLDANGDEIKYLRDENGSVLEYLKPKELVKIPSYYYELAIDYTGNVPEGCKYHIVPTEQRSRYGNINGYKMAVRGTDIDNHDNRGQMTKASSVHKKILEIIDSKFKQLEYQRERKLSVKRIVDKFNVEFSDFTKNVTSTYETVFYLKLDNGITLTISGYEDSNGNIRFVKDKVYFPSNMNTISLVNQLSAIKGEQ